ncbi:hypothetical protein QJQ45_019603, partial [Haematococcus lacustris]
PIDRCGFKSVHSPLFARALAILAPPVPGITGFATAVFSGAEQDDWVALDKIEHLAACGLVVLLVFFLTSLLPKLALPRISFFWRVLVAFLAGCFAGLVKEFGDYAHVGPYLLRLQQRPAAAAALRPALLNRPPADDSAGREHVGGPHADPGLTLAWHHLASSSCSASSSSPPGVSGLAPAGLGAWKEPVSAFSTPAAAPAHPAAPPGPPLSFPTPEPCGQGLGLQRDPPATPALGAEVVDLALPGDSSSSSSSGGSSVVEQQVGRGGAEGGPPARAKPASQPRDGQAVRAGGLQSGEGEGAGLGGGGGQGGAETKATLLGLGGVEGQGGGEGWGGKRGGGGGPVARGPAGAGAGVLGAGVAAPVAAAVEGEAPGVAGDSATAEPCAGAGVRGITAVCVPLSSSSPPLAAPCSVSGEGKEKREGRGEGKGGSDCGGAPLLGNVGFVVWQSGYLLAELLVRLQPLGPWGCHVHVLDLGSGTGVVGLALALAGARVTLTDLPHILPLTQLNADTNCPPPCSVSLLPHSWGQDTQQLLLQAGAFDIITGADLLYEPALYPALLGSLLGLMAPHSTAFLAYRKRCRAEEGFRDAAEARGLAVEDVPSALLDSEFRDGAYAVLRLAPARECGKVRLCAITYVLACMVSRSRIWQQRLQPCLCRYPCRTLNQVNWNRYPSFPWCNCDRTTVTPFALRYVGMSTIGAEQFACFNLFLASVPPNPSPCYSMDLYKIEFDIGAPRFNSRGLFNGSNIAMSWHAGPAPRSVIKFTGLSVTQASVASAPGGSIGACFTVPLGSTLTSLSTTGGESITYAIFNAPSSRPDCCPVGTTGARSPPPPRPPPSLASSPLTSPTISQASPSLASSPLTPPTISQASPSLASSPLTPPTISQASPSLASSPLTSPTISQASPSLASSPLTPPTIPFSFSPSPTPPSPSPTPTPTVSPHQSSKATHSRHHPGHHPRHLSSPLSHSANNVACRQAVAGSAMLDSRTVYRTWETSRPVLKYTNLNIPYGTQATLTFELTSQCTLDKLCGGVGFCTYAPFDTTGTSGFCPTSDKSRKGSVDERALPIIRLINARADMFTTSSCSGRISVFAEPTEVNRQSGKKGGEWVYCSHEPADEEEVLSRLAARCHTGGTLVLRFEPFLLHAECRDMAAASWLLQAARGAGFRESGATLGARGSRVMAGVRCALRLEVPVADGGALLVGDTYLRYLVALANTKFGLNTARMRHLELLLRPPSPETHPLTPTSAPTPSSPPPHLTSLTPTQCQQGQARPP